jgi:hypothetical protein
MTGERVVRNDSTHPLMLAAAQGHWSRTIAALGSPAIWTRLIGLRIALVGFWPKSHGLLYMVTQQAGAGSRERFFSKSTGDMLAP